MKLQLANYRSCLLLCVPFNSFLPSKRLALSFESRIDIKGKTLPFIIHGASSTHWRVETEEKSSAGGFNLCVGSGCPRSPYPWWLCRSHSRLAPNRLETHLAQPNRRKEHHTCNLIKGSFKGACPSGL